MTKELEFYNIEHNYGGSQSWWSSGHQFRKNGCGIVTATHLIADPKVKYTKEEFLNLMTQYGEIMSPKWYGIPSVQSFIRKLLKVVQGKNISYSVKYIKGYKIKKRILSFIEEGLNKGVYIAAFNGNKLTKNGYHWVTITGLMIGEERQIIISNYGRKMIVDFDTYYKSSLGYGGYVYIEKS